MEISQLLVTKAEDCPEQELIENIRDKADQIQNFAKTLGEIYLKEHTDLAMGYRELISSDAWMLNNLLQKLSHK